MIRLLRAELVADWRAWAGLAMVSAVAALACGVGASMLETGMHAGGEYLDGFSGAAAMVLIFSGVSAVAVMAAIARLAVALGRAGYARWQLAGVGPAQIAVIVIAQVLAASMIGAVVGVLLTAVVAEPAVHAAFEDGTGGYREIPIVVGPLTVTVAVAGAAASALLGGARPALSAARTPPLAALVEPEVHGKQMRWWRWILLAVAVAAAGGFLGSALGAATRRELIAQAPLIAPALTIVLLAAGPLLYPAVLRAWTALLPATASASWHLARHQARYHLGRSTASITPLFAGAALLGGLYATAGTVDAALRASGHGRAQLQAAQVLLMLGGPVMLAVAGAAIVIFMSNRTQGHEQALLSATGASPAVILRAAVWQAVIHVATAALLAAAVIATTSVTTAAAFGRFLPGTVPVVDPLPPALLVAAGLALTVLATVLPVTTRPRRTVVDRLGAR